MEILRKHRAVWIFLTALTLVVFIWIQYGFTTDRTLLHSVHHKSSSIKTILFWTSEWGSKKKAWWGLGPYIGDTSFFRPCKHQCVLSANRSRSEEADVLLFYYNDGPDWPAVRHPFQTYAHFVHEPPHTRAPIDIRKYEGRINITIHYRHDADLYVPYFAFVKKPKMSGIPLYVPKVRLKDKPKSAVWAVSNCRAPSKRDNYVRELSKHIDVDIYGRCGTHKCEKKDVSHCQKMFERQYKFYLSFENNVCKDYISEKAYGYLYKDIIPVVLGGGDYESDLPKHSVINVKDFASPKALAEYLHQLSQNETLYNSYFQWKRDFALQDRFPKYQSVFCALCDGVHDGRLLKPASTHYHDWYYGKHGEVCDNHLVTRLLGHTTG